MMEAFEATQNKKAILKVGNCWKKINWLSTFVTTALFLLENANKSVYSG